ncbi:helix-turn-helix domain-containing protein [Streptacidiphilus anmyonensis]|uniref:helix-turn-helix domain-containing protein n=1 Tax=Streptacidiphilus anmyonensis TaxID=405782 RepID=UPI0005A63E8D|nr:helix-turn-helix transcriptional regulator [Streptacidiphilus anmyonensis]
MAHYPNPFAALRAGWLIARARKATPGLSQAALAEELGIGQGTLSKYESGAREPSFADLQRIIARTDFRLEVQLRPESQHPDPIRQLTANSAEFTPFATSDLSLRQRMPAQLTPPHGRLAASIADGPLVEEALLHLYEIRQLARAARLPEARLQETYAQWHSERDRDLIHQFLSVGAGAGQASARLARQIDAGTARPGRGRTKAGQGDQRIPRLVWAHIVCCLRAEEMICRERVSWLRHALDLAAARRGARAHVENAERMARIRREHFGEDAEAGTDLADAQAELETAIQRCCDVSMHTGGESVGMAGERYLAVELTTLADRARHLYEQFAQEPAFKAWCAEHSDLDPLYHAWLDGPLSDFLAPPPLYTALDDLTGFLYQLPKPARGNEPFGPAERTVYDHLDRAWQLVVPAHDPKTNDKAGMARPRAAVLALATREAGTPAVSPAAYVLAHEADRAKALDVIAALPGTDLTGAAAALRTL